MPATLDFTRPHVLRTGEEYEAAVERIDTLLVEAEPGSFEEEELRFLALLVEAYEDENYPIEEAAPQEVVEFVLEQKGLERSDLHEAMGGRSRVSEFFSGKRSLSIAQVKALRDLLGIPADALLTYDE